MSTEPVGTTPWTTEQFQFDIAQVPFLQVAASGGAAAVWLVEIEPYMAQSKAMPLTMYAPGIVGVVGLGEEFTAYLSVAEAAPLEQHSSIAQGLGVVSSNRLISDRLQVRRFLPQIGERLGGFLAETSGIIELDGSEGALDYLITQRVLRDRPVRLKSAFSTRLPNGRIQQPALADFGTNFVGRITNAEISSSDSRLALTVQDGWKRLDRPIQDRLYLGTGGLEGGEDLAGKPPPLCYGDCPNVTPTPLDRIKGIWHVHDGGEVLSIRARDMGVYLRQVREVDTLEQLAALTQQGEVEDPDISLGEFAVCRKLGIFRTAGGVKITADVQGDGLYDGFITFTNGVLFTGGVGFSAPGERTHRRYPAGIVYRILFSRAGFKDEELDLERMIQHDAERPFRMGVYISSNERPTVREVCAKVADSAAAFIVRNTFGQIYLAPMEPPAAFSPIRIDHINLAQPFERRALPWGAPWPQIKVHCAPNWTPMTQQEISDELLGTEEEALLLQEGQVVVASDESMAPLLPDREALEISTYLRERDDALKVARAFLAFYAGRWATWKVVAYGLSGRVDVLRTAILAQPRFGLNDGVPMLIIGLEERPGEGETELTLL